MFGRYLLLSAAVLALTPAAQAGNLNYVDGRSSWTSTMCTHPARPASLAAHPDTEANDLNEQVNAYNKYTIQVQAYMECLSREAERDIAGAQQTVTGEAQKSMKAAQGELKQIQAQLQQNEQHEQQ